MHDTPLAIQASAMQIATMFDRQVQLQGARLAVESKRLSLSYLELDRRAWRLARVLQDSGVGRGDRVCILGENDPEFVVLSIAALRLGACVATLNTRLTSSELGHCIRLVTPKVLMASTRQASRVIELALTDVKVLEFGEGTALDVQLSCRDSTGVANAGLESHPEDIQFIIYTSGTTGLPKGAMISQRAMLARLMVYVLDYGVDGGDTFIAWSPLCHMASVELGFGTLLLGGKVVVMDGPDLPTICDYLERESLSNLIFFPGMVQQTLDYLRERKPKVRRLKKFGALADLFTPADIAQLTSLLGQPFTNTFGSTETGMPPLSAGRLKAGEVPRDFGKLPSALCEISLRDPEQNEVAVGEVGELAVRGPTLFSGYWSAPEATAEALDGGWYSSGDMFRKRADGRYDYVDRRKYLIKSGGENIYPAEIERIILTHPGIADAIVVRRADSRWGEVPVVVAETRGTPPSEEDLIALCTRELAAFKRPKGVLFVPAGELPRSGTGKIVRAEVEAWVARQAPGSAS